MSNNKILTAEEFIKERYDWSSSDLEKWIENLSKLPMADYSNVIDLMESFAKYHRKNALEAAVEDISEGPSEAMEKCILESYPEENIK